MKPIDIFICCYLRHAYTEKTISYLYERTKYPFRLFVIDQGGNDEVLDAAGDKIFERIKLMPNAGIHAAWNIALALAESDYFITGDNDIYVPDLVGVDLNPFYGKSEGEIGIDILRDIGQAPSDDWLGRLVILMNERPDYGAISLCPQALIGAAGIDPKDPQDVVERNMTGAYMRIMRRDAVWKAGGWDKVIRTGRNHEERTICGRLQEQGYKIGIATRLRCFHPFGPNWGYPEEFTPEQQMHNPALKDYVQSFGKIENYNDKTWLPK